MGARRATAARYLGIRLAWDPNHFRKEAPGGATAARTDRRLLRVTRATVALLFPGDRPLQLGIVLTKFPFAMTNRADQMLADLKQAGLKLTPQRIAIVREIADDLTHPTAQTLFERLHPAFPTMSFATVYNTLGALARCGLTGSLALGGAIRFDPNTEPHHHAVCDGCGAVEDIPAPRVTEELPDPKHLNGFHVLREERTYRGLCASCTATRLRNKETTSWESH